MSGLSQLRAFCCTLCLRVDAGKTQLINHFLINNNWYLVDLPGYG